MYYPSCDSSFLYWIFPLILSSNWFHSDILGAVKHINDMYEQVTRSGGESSSPKQPFSLCSLKFNPRRIVYNRLKDGQYRVLLWVDFFTEAQERKKYKRGISLMNTKIWMKYVIFKIITKSIIFYTIVENYAKFLRTHFIFYMLNKNRYMLF